MVIIMAKMRQMDVKEQAKAKTFEALQNGSFFEKAEKIGAYEFAYPTEFDINGDGQMTEVWTTVELTAKNWYATSKSTAFDPFEKADEYAQTLADRQARADEIARKKAEKLAKKNQKANGGE